MEANVESQAYVISSPEENTAIEMSNSETQSQLTSGNEVNEELREIGTKISNFLEQLPNYLTRFYQAYKVPIISLGLLIAAIVTIKLISAVMNALNSLPLLSGTLELLGLSFAIWFTVRYLIKASTRQELAVEIQILKEQILGRNSKETLS
jgi:CAAD domains of cyanobacterial aminoacyl-tRNA synthetase